MGRKIHLRRNKIDEGQTPIAVCAARSIGNGKCIPNSRSTYRFMASEIVDINGFRAAPASDRCAHCCDMGLVFINQLRAKKGKEPRTSLFN